MPVQVLGTRDKTTDSFAATLEAYAANHLSADIQVYRHSPVAVRVRVVDPDFHGKTRTERHREVWPLLYKLDQDTLEELGKLLLIAPEQQEFSMVNREFQAGLYAKAYEKALRSTQSKAGTES